MPFELSNSLKNTCGWSFASKGMNGLFHSKFYTSAILTVMIIILIMVIYPGQKNTPMWILAKLGFYIFIVSIGIIFMHDCVSYNEYSKKVGGAEDETIIAAMGGENNIAFGGNDDIIPVKHSTGDSAGGCKSGASGETGEPHADTTGGDSIFALYGV